ncbi:MAG: hypothetical protein AAFX06_06510 [Planctomycetota bacterium]
MSDSDLLREELVAKIKTFLLTYDENQLLHGSNYRLVVRSLDSKRRFFAAVLCSACLFSLVMVVRSLLSGNTPVFFGLCAATSGWWAWRRIRKLLAVYRALTAYLEVTPDGDAQPETLADELKLGFRLEYSDYQAIRAGQEREVAQRVIRRRETNLLTFLSAAATVGVALISVAGSTALEMLLTMLVSFFIAATPFILGAVFEYRACRRLKGLLRKYA